MNLPSIHNFPKKSVFSILIFIYFLLTGCIPDNEYDFQKYWQYEDLRALDPVDAEQHYQDIVAVYIKQYPKSISLRLDILDLEPNDPIKLFIGVDYMPGGMDIQTGSFESLEWDIIFEFPSQGEIRGYNSYGEMINGLKASIFKDPLLDFVTLHVSADDIFARSKNITFDIFSIDQNTGIVKDSITSVNSHSLPPSPANLSLVFWYSALSYTPAQTLRMWDGAHAGPLSSRHGLRYLVEAADYYGIPVVICADRMVGGLVGLDYLGVVDRLGGEFVDWGDCGGFGVSSIDYTNNPLLYEDSSLPIELRKMLLEVALNGNKYLLGGDLSNSLWAVPSVSARVFQYIAEHPWILPERTTKFFDSGLTTKNFHSEHPFENFGINPTLFNQFINAYYSTPENTLKRSVYQAYLTLLDPTSQVDVDTLENYFGQLGHILSAAAWMENPHPITTCQLDLDWDGHEECVLATDNVFLTVEQTGGYMGFAFYRDEYGIHQITAPMSQVAVGLGDPLSYKPDKDVFSDPTLIPGALAIEDQKDFLFDYQIGERTIDLYHRTFGMISKTFRIIDQGIEIIWNSNTSMAVKVPIILDPWNRYESNWGGNYYKQEKEDGWIWGIHNSIEIVINSTAEFQFNTFIDSKPYILQPEDPNLEYPIGHYLPFPAAIIDFGTIKNAVLELNFD